MRGHGGRGLFLNTFALPLGAALADREKRKKEKGTTMFDEEAELSGEELESDEDEDALGMREGP